MITQRRSGIDPHTHHSTTRVAKRLDQTCIEKVGDFERATTGGRSPSGGALEEYSVGPDVPAVANDDAQDDHPVDGPESRKEAAEDSLAIRNGPTDFFKIHSATKWPTP